MKLIIGGAYQGKLDYACKTFHIKKEDFCDGGSCGREEVFAGRGIYHFHEYIRRCLEKGWDTDKLAERMKQENPEMIVVSTELGCGVVPVEAFDREYRERVGRICTQLADDSEEVHRVVCGLGMVLKSQKDEGEKDD